MTQTNNIVAKAAVAFVAVAMAFSLVAPAAQAQDVSSMSLEQLIALVNSLQNQLGGASSSSSCSYTFTRSLGQGASGADVMNLQKFLNMSADTQVAMSGAGSPGMETSFYGPATAAAVSKFQTKYSADILVPSGLTSPTGYFGPSSMAKANMLCSTSGGSTGGNTGGNTGGSTGGLQGGVGDITINETSSGVEDEVMEGEDDVVVLGFDVEADDSDVEVTSVRVEFEHDGAGSDNLEDYVTEVSVWLDGEMLGSADADDFSESSDVYSRNITLDGGIVREGDEGRFYVAVSAVNNIDSDDIGENWEVALGQVRFEDGTGAILTDTTGTGVNGSISETFTFEDLASAGDVELTVREDDDDINDAQTIQVDDSSDTNDVEILSFTIEAEGSDMELQTLIFDVTSVGAGVTEIANEFRLMMGDEEVGRAFLDLNQDNDRTDAGEGSGFASSSDTAVAIIIEDLDDDDVMIEEGDEVSFTLVADINDTNGGFTNGDSLSVSLVASATDTAADDENGDNVTDFNGSANSGPLAFASSGLMVKLVSSTAAQQLNLDSTSADDEGKFEMVFDVTAFEDTAYVQLTSGSSTDAATSDFGAAFSIENTNDVTVAAGSNTSSLERVSGGTTGQANNTVRINPGQTAQFRLTVYYNPTATGIYRVQMNEVGFAATAVAATTAEDTVPAANFQSNSVQVQN